MSAPKPPPYGGIANWTRLISRQAEFRADIRLCVVDTAPRWRAVDDLSVWKRMLGGGLQLVRDYARFRRSLEAGQDVVHLTTSGGLAVVRDLAVLATARRQGIPAIYHLHFGRVPQMAAGSTRQWRLLARAIRMARLVLAIDPGTAATIEHHLPGVRVLRVPNAADLAALPEGLPSSRPRTLLYLGWLVPTKGVSELVQAWKDLGPEGWRCILAGPGSPQYRRRLLDEYKPENLEILPEQPHTDAMRLLAAADVFVLPSHTEGFSNVIVEAMAMGKAIVATGVGAIPEMLAGDCGVVVPPRDVQSLRGALQRIMSDESMRVAMGARARDKARAEYAMDKVFEQLLDVWRNAGRDARTVTQ